MWFSSVQPTVISAILQPTPHPNPNTHTYALFLIFNLFLSLPDPVSLSFGRTFHYKIVRMKQKMVESERTYVNLLSGSFVTSCTAPSLSTFFSLSIPHLSVFPLLHFNTTTVVNLRGKRKRKQSREFPDMSWVGGQAHTRATGHQADTTAWELDRITSSTLVKTNYSSTIRVREECYYGL